MRLRTLVLVAALALPQAACLTESNRTLEPERIDDLPPYSGPRQPLVVGKFANRSTYLRGAFSSGDPMGSQAKTILKTHLQQTGRFVLVDRDNLAELSQEAEITGQAQQLKGANVAVSGDVTQFGRRTVGDTQLFGILGYGKKQQAYATVALNVIDVGSSEVLYSVQGAGEYTLSNREVLGTGSAAGYDATLNGKVLDLAIREAVRNLVVGLENGQWNPAGGS